MIEGVGLSGVQVERPDSATVGGKGHRQDAAELQVEGSRREMGEPGVGLEDVDPDDLTRVQCGQTGPFRGSVLDEVDLHRQPVGDGDARRLTVDDEADAGCVARGEGPLDKGDDRLELGEERSLRLEQLRHPRQLLDGLWREMFHPGS